jgi:hypothetical protein
MTDKDRTDEILNAIEGVRQQNSAQHDEQLSVLKDNRGILIWLKAKWERFTRPGTWPGDSR